MKSTSKGPVGRRAGRGSRVALALVGSLVLAACGTSKDPGASPSASSAGQVAAGISTQEPPETWALTIQQGGLTETVVVAVTFGLDGPTFSQSGTGGWFFVLPAQTVNVAGSIVGSNWQFTNMTGSGDGVTLTGGGSGQANGAYPIATSVSGTVTWNLRSSSGTQVETSSWSGVRTQ